ncbi:O-antigen ligase family protein [Desulfobacterium sp. N47]|uniref:O-antigen ligase-related domain-containing protein n=1 Tax=uncultured Desulfobacterium sp. TaxID=201089 RepID=E1YK57_9BACT|nr:hypothetical protein N47_E51730 [uncultured Desulfobacterium sp.]
MYVIFFAATLFFFYNFGTLFIPLLQRMSIPSGFYSAPTSVIAAFCALLFFFQTRNKKQFLREFLFTIIAWAPWLIYLTYRCDFNDRYSLQKLILMFLSFGYVLMFCCAFHKDKEKFSRYFWVCSVAMIASTLIYFFFKHSVPVLHGYRFEGRLSIQSANSIGISRSFAIGALTLLVWGRFSYWIKIGLCLPFFIGMYMTGSRGPAISLLIIIICHFLWINGHNKLLNWRILLACLSLIIAAWTVDVFFHNQIEKYFSRGDKRGMYLQSGRYAGAIETWKEFTSAPFSGVGLGKYGKPGTQIFSTVSQSKKNIEREYPHNILYEVAAELGIVGAILFIFLLRPGPWMFDFSNKFVLLFLLCFLFAMTSGDFRDNSGVFIFGYIARFNRKYFSAE